MDAEQLRNLINHDEGPSLDFKSRWYKIDGDDKAAEYEKNELIKDILALANGNTNVAGDRAYLVIGVADMFDENGHRELFEIEPDKPVTRDRLLKIINCACDLALEELWCDFIVMESKRLLVITIPPSPHVHETTIRLQCVKRAYDEFTVFVRHGSEINTASSKERQSLVQLKRLRFDERRNAPPIRFGTLVGALAGGMVLAPITEKYTERKEGLVAGGVVGSIMGGALGGMAGSAYKDYQSIKTDWHRIPIWGRVVSVSGGALAAIGFWAAISLLRKKLKAGKKEI